MATPAQQAAFVGTYGPFATQAGNTLGVSPNIILGQWAFESAWGTQGSAAGMGNMAGINVPGSTTGTNYQGYSSPQAFTNSYVNTIQTNFPNAMNTGNDVGAFNNGLQSGVGGRLYYTGNPQVYGNGLASNANAISNINPNLSTSTTGGSLASNSSPDYTTNPSDMSLAEQSSFGDVPQQATAPSIDVGGSGYNPSASPGQFGSESTPIGGTTQGGTFSGTGGTGLGGTSNFNAAAGGTGIGFPITAGLQPGAALTFGSIGTNIGNSITGVGQTMTNAFTGFFGELESWLGRGMLIFLGIVLLAIALWRAMDPSGEKTQAFVRGAAEAA